MSKSRRHLDLMTVWEEAHPKYGYFQLHCEEGPAVEWDNGNNVWYNRGLIHRDDGPAIEYTNGFKAWYKKGSLIRSEGELPGGLVTKNKGKGLF